MKNIFIGNIFRRQHDPYKDLKDMPPYPDRLYGPNFWVDENKHMIATFYSEFNKAKMKYIGSYDIDLGPLVYKGDRTV